MRYFSVFILLTVSIKGLAQINDTSSVTIKYLDHSNNGIIDLQDIIIMIHQLSLDGQINAYSPNSMNDAIPVSQLDSSHVECQIINVPDSKSIYGRLDEVVCIRRTPAELYNGLYVVIKWTNTEVGNSKANIIGLGLLRNFKYSYTNKIYPGIYVRFDKLIPFLSPIQLSRLGLHLTYRFREQKIHTPIYSSEKKLFSKPNTFFSLESFKTKEFYEKHDLFLDGELNDKINFYEDFSAIFTTIDTSYNYRRSRRFNAQRWEFFDHLIYYCQYEVDTIDFSISCKVVSVGVSVPGAFSNQKSFFMGVDTFLNTIPPWAEPIFIAEFKKALLSVLKYNMDR